MCRLVPLPYLNWLCFAPSARDEHLPLPLPAPVSVCLSVCLSACVQVQVHAGGKNDVDGFGEFALFYCSLKLYVIASHLRMLWPQIMDLRTDRVVRGLLCPLTLLARRTTCSGTPT